MNSKLSYTVSAMLCAVATMVPLSARAQTTAPGPYYAWPAWDQQLQCDTQATCPRFVVLSNWRDHFFPSGGAAVLDRETGLVWERTPSSPALGWQNASTFCAAKAVGSRRGWRLATLQELASLADVSRFGDPTFMGPALPPGHPFIDVQADFYWSSSTFASTPDIAYGVAMSQGVTGTDFKSMGHLSWCVRGGQGVDPQ